jgi:hypothetical protein
MSTKKEKNVSGNEVRLEYVSRWNMCQTLASQIYKSDVDVDELADFMRMFAARPKLPVIRVRK